MSDDKQKFTELIKDLVTAGLIGVVAATIKALMTKTENLPNLFRNFFAGVLFALLVGYILHTSTVSEMWKAIIIASSASFISSFWPLLEQLVRKYIIKKGKDVTDIDIS